MSSAGGTVVCQHYPCWNMGVGYQVHQVLRSRVWVWEIADVVPLFPHCSFEYNSLPLI